MILADVTHTDAHELAQFERLTIPEQLREIWLNGRETNGHVADALRDIGELQRFRDRELKPWMAQIDRRVAVAAGVVVFVLAAAPIVFWLLDRFTMNGG